MYRVIVAVRLMSALGAERTEHTVAWLAEEQLLLEMSGALRNDFAPLFVHQIKQLINDERGWKRGNAAPWQQNVLAADWTSKAIGDARLIGDLLEAAFAKGVRAGELLGRALERVVRTQAGRAGEKAFGEIFVVDGDGLDQRGGGDHFDVVRSLNE